MNKDNFLHPQNISENYKFVCQNVNQKTGKNLAKYSGLKLQFEKMAQIVADKSTAQDLNNLSLLNSKLVNNATDFFCKQLGKRADIAAANSVDALASGYKYLAPSDNPTQEYTQFSNQQADSLQQMGKSRANYNMPLAASARVSANSQTIVDSNQSSLHPNNETVMDMMLNRGQLLNQNNNNTPGVNTTSVAPFNLDDEIANMMSNEPGQDLPLYQNIMDLQDVSESDPMELAQRLEQERQNMSRTTSDKMLSYNDLNIGQREQATARMIQKRGEANIMEARNNTDAETLSQHTTLVDPLELYKTSEFGKKQIMDRMTNGSVSGNDVRSIDPVVDNLFMEKLLSLQRELQPKYMEKTNYIIVNSVDRDWFNNPSDTRYSFRVNFKPNRYYQGAGIIDIYKNITSVELVNAVMPQDCVHIPFDNRMYIDILSFPYLLLQIPEITDVFRGTNSHNDRTFSVLMFDKQHDGSVLSYDYISGSNSIVNSYPTTQFYREYRKTFYKYTPAYFEKKQYYNQPLASLGHMTINLATPAGENLNTLPDVLSINNVAYTPNFSALSTGYEYDVATSYPNDSAWGTRQYIQINTTSCFSNKLFRLGDLIRIKGYGLDDTSGNGSAFVNFINREEGHYILNTDLCSHYVQSSGANNQGFTANIYIAPPGTLTSNLCMLDPATYYSNTTVNQASYTTFKSNGLAKLINVNLQTHYCFKITTRDGDVQSVTRPMNV